MKSNYEKLIVWQKAVDLSMRIYEVTKKFPKEEIYGLTSQMRRASVSIPSNIAEGSERNNKGEFKQFLGIAKGSTAELETQVFIAFKLKYISDIERETIKGKTIEILKILGTLIHKLI